MLRINVSKIIEQPGLTLSFSEIGNIKPFGEQSQIGVKNSIFQVEGIATSTGSGIYVQANAKGTIRLTCSRCLGNFDHQIEFSCEGNFVHDIGAKASSEDDIESFLLDGEHIVLDNMLQHEILLNIPMKPLCNRNCKGFCEICGVNLNETQCECTDHDTQSTPFGRKLLEALEKGGKKDGGSKKKNF